MNFSKMRCPMFLMIAYTLIGCAPLETYPALDTSEISGDFECPKVYDMPRKSYHLIRANRDGKIIDPLARTESMERPLSPREGLEKMQLILCGAERAAQLEGWEEVNLMVYVHGGLNRFNASNKRLKKVGTIIDAQEYPVYLAWPSGGVTTWAEHVFRVRAGKKANPVVGVATSPAVLLTDLAKGIAEYPSTLTYQLGNEKDRVVSNIYPKWLANSWEDSRSLFCDPVDQHYSCCKKIIETDEGLEANYSFYDTKPGNSMLRGSSQLVTLPFRYTIGTLWHSGISSASWDNMKRRAINIAYPTNEFDSRYGGGINAGAFFKLMLERAGVYQRKHGKKYAISLVAHSMGTIVINNVLTRYQSDWEQTPYLKNIVYMAGAASIGDTLQALKPVLVSRPDVGGRLEDFTPNFYNLTLNRVAEVSEMHWGGVVPTGSLLVSIDQHHEKPEHPLNRTIGSEVNVLSSIKIINEALASSKGKKVFKSFDRRVGAIPAVHGDFGILDYWMPETWEIEKMGQNEPTSN